jgi:predicted exporter
MSTITEPQTRSATTVPQAPPATDPAHRAVTSTGLLGIALIHLLDLPGKLHETPYLGVAYLGLIAASLVLAGALLRRDDRRLWLASGALAMAVLVGFIVNRTVGMPDATDDIGNWLEPLGLASLFVEGVVTLLAIDRLVRHS